MRRQCCGGEKLHFSAHLKRLPPKSQHNICDLQLMLNVASVSGKIVLSLGASPIMKFSIFLGGKPLAWDVKKNFCVIQEMLQNFPDIFGILAAVLNGPSPDNRVARGCFSMLGRGRQVHKASVLRSPYSKSLVLASIARCW